MKKIIRILALVAFSSLLTIVGCNRVDHEKEDRHAKAEEKRIEAQHQNPAQTGDNNVLFSKSDEKQQDEKTSTKVSAVEIFRIANDSGVLNGGRPTTFTLKSNCIMTELITYHWNDGKGFPAGTITITADNGTKYGPWQAVLTDKFYWVVKITTELPMGTYTLTDSDPKTHSQNEGTKGMGMAWASGFIK